MTLADLRPSGANSLTTLEDSPFPIRFRRLSNGRHFLFRDGRGQWIIRPRNASISGPLHERHTDMTLERRVPQWMAKGELFRVYLRNFSWNRGILDDRTVHRDRRLVLSLMLLAELLGPTIHVILAYDRSDTLPGRYWQREPVQCQDSSSVVQYLLVSPPREFPPLVAVFCALLLSSGSVHC